jgi:hypothetical protein
MRYGLLLEGEGQVLSFFDCRTGLRNRPALKVRLQILPHPIRSRLVPSVSGNVPISNYLLPHLVRFLQGKWQRRKPKAFEPPHEAMNPELLSPRPCAALSTLVLARAPRNHVYSGTGSRQYFWRDAHWSDSLRRALGSVV